MADVRPERLRASRAARGASESPRPRSHASSGLPTGSMRCGYPGARTSHLAVDDLGVGGLDGHAVHPEPALPSLRVKAGLSDCVVAHSVAASASPTLATVDRTATRIAASSMEAWPTRASGRPIAVRTLVSLWTGATLHSQSGRYSKSNAPMARMMPETIGSKSSRARAPEVGRR